MKTPYLQIALDNVSLEDAFRTLSGGLGQEVDIIEVGTMLILMEGMHAVRILQACFPDKIMVADAQLSVAHFGPKILSGGTQFVTMFSPAQRGQSGNSILCQRAWPGGSNRAVWRLWRRLDIRRPAGMEEPGDQPDHLRPPQLRLRSVDLPGCRFRAPAV